MQNLIDRSMEQTSNWAYYNPDRRFPEQILCQEFICILIEFRLATRVPLPYLLNSQVSNQNQHPNHCLKGIYCIGSCKQKLNKPKLSESQFDYDDTGISY